MSQLPAREEDCTVRYFTETFFSHHVHNTTPLLSDLRHDRRFCHEGLRGGVVFYAFHCNFRPSVVSQHDIWEAHIADYHNAHHTYSTSVKFFSSFTPVLIRKTIPKSWSVQHHSRHIPCIDCYIRVIECTGTYLQTLLSRWSGSASAPSCLETSRLGTERDRHHQSRPTTSLLRVKPNSDHTEGRSPCHTSTLALGSSGHFFLCNVALTAKDTTSGEEQSQFQWPWLRVAPES